MSQLKPQTYRDVIDELVHVCRVAQGQIGADRALAGVWHPQATLETMPEQYEVNQFLGRLSGADRAILAKMLADEVVTGVFETLKVLEQFAIEPFNEGYEGSPFNDFIGRLDEWEWPEP